MSHPLYTVSTRPKNPRGGGRTMANGVRSEDRHDRLDRVDVPLSQRERARHVRRWAIGRGHTLSSEALAVLLHAKSMRPEAQDTWTADAVSELLWNGLLEWCRQAGVA